MGHMLRIVAKDTLEDAMNEGHYAGAVLEPDYIGGNTVHKTETKVSVPWIEEQMYQCPFSHVRWRPGGRYYELYLNPVTTRIRGVWLDFVMLRGLTPATVA